LNQIICTFVVDFESCLDLLSWMDLYLCKVIKNVG
jgi:hypothetical protein